MFTKHRIAALVGAALSAIALLSFSFGSVSADGGARRVTVTDDCDPVTFNAILGAGACVGNGNTTFQAFLGELTATKSVKAWRFLPSATAGPAGQNIVAVNAGGEGHTFTCVTQFGGGVVALLNQLSGNTTPAVLCPGESFGASMIAPGGSRTVTLGNGPVAMYECLIHPWMRITVRVENAAS